jgi:tRNA pseudouridine38-40 synthase
MKQNFKLIIEYDGTSFFGWQRQLKEITIQGELESALSLILNQKIKINGSGRTDAGVHALGQVANFHAETSMYPGILKKGINSLMKQPIVIHDCSLVDSKFHARYNAKSKEYNYFILNRPDPCALGASYVWHIKKPLDLGPMNHCCGLITGSHDFKSFENTGSPRSSTIREVFFARVEPHKEDQVVFKISATGFLKNMVRNLIGTLVDAGLKKITVKEFEAILLARNRALAGNTAPARGLLLKQVNYS